MMNVDKMALQKVKVRVSSSLVIAKTDEVKNKKKHSCHLTTFKHGAKVSLSPCGVTPNAQGRAGAVIAVASNCSLTSCRGHSTLVESISSDAGR